VEIFERDEVFHRLEALLELAREGDGRVALIRGDAGIGKTTAAKEFIRSIEHEAHVLVGSCDDLLAPRSLSPFWDMALEESKLSKAVIENDRSQVLKVLMELSTRALRPTVLVVEDIHWADGATLDLISALGRRIDRTHAVLVLTFRDNLPADHPLYTSLGDLPLSHVQNFSLEPLTYQSVLKMSPSEEEADRIWSLTAGNPLFVVELLDESRDVIPVSIRDVVKSQLGRVTAKCEQLVKIASVVPGSVELSLVDEIDPGLGDSIGEAEDHGLVTVDGDSLVFRHELVRTTVESLLSETTRRDTNSKVLRASESLGLDVARCAHHARMAHDQDAMIRLLPVAAEDAASVHNHREAVSHLRALEPHLDRVPPQRRAGIYEMWSFEEDFVSGSGLNQALEAVEIRRSLENAAELGRCLLRASRSAYFGGDRALAESMAREAVEVLGSVGGEHLAEGYAEISRLEMLNHNLEDAIDYGERALVSAPIISRARANALTNVGTARALLAYPAGADELYESIRICDELTLGRERHRARGNLIAVALIWRDLATAGKLNDLVLDELDDESSAETAWHLAARTSILLLRGDYGAADSLLVELLSRGALESGDRIWIAAAYAKTLIRTGHHDAQTALEDAWEMAEHFGEVQDANVLAAVWAEYQWAFQRADRSVTERNVELLRKADRNGIPWTIGEIALWLWLDGHIEQIPTTAAPPIRWLGEGEHRRSANWFSEQGLPYEQAAALSVGEEDDQLEALTIAETIGAKALAARLRRQLRAQGIKRIPRGPREATRNSPIGLTARQAEVLELLGEGLSNSAIAQRLFLSPRTVEKHVAAVLSKTGAPTRDSAVALARERGLLTDKP
jgi:DNA-binding CsgD family transcriptional regulator